MWPKVALACVVAQAGCLKADVVDCKNGLQCPVGTVCWEERLTCVDVRGLTVAEGPFDFGRVRCGEGGTLVVELQNFGITAIEFDASSTLDGVVVTPSAGTVEAGATLPVTLEAMPVAQSIPGVGINGTLEIETVVGHLQRPVRLTTVGGVAEVQPLVDFGEAMVGVPKTGDLVITNTGNAAFGVTLGLTGSGFALQESVPAVQVAAMSSQTFMLDFVPATIRPWEGAVTLTYDQPLCQPPPDLVALAGSGTGSPLLVDHTAVNFGAAACSAAAATRPVVLTNYLPTAQTLALSVTGTEAADFSVPATAVVSAGGSVTIDVTRLANPALTMPKLRAARLEIVASPSGETKSIPLTHTIAGPLLKADLESVRVNTGFSPVSVLVHVVNSGTAIANVTTTPGGFAANGTTVTLLPNPFQVGVGSTTIPTIRVTPGGTNAHIVDTFRLSAPGQCSEPIEIDVDATVTLFIEPPSPD